jgi:DNA-binding NarL/FixJ family response regulator
MRWRNDDSHIARCWSLAMSEAAVAAVFLLAQNRLLREALAKILGKKNDIAVVGACAFSGTALEGIERASPEVLVMDSFGAATDELGFLREVKARIPELKIVLIGMDPDEQVFLQAVREGVLGYVLENASAVEVVNTVRAVANGDAICPPKLCAALFRYVARQKNCMPNFRVRLNLGLTNREQQLVLLIGRGLTNKEIANQLQLAEQTVRNHVHRMLRKVGASDRHAVVELCRMQGLPI